MKFLPITLNVLQKTECNIVRWQTYDERFYVRLKE